MELASLLNGFVQALTPMNLLVCAAGVLVGTLVGVLPGLGPASAIAILLPLTVVLEPAQSIIMLAGIYYGSQYGGSTTAILMNIPGEASSVVTCIDGYPMAKQGKGGKALRKFRVCRPLFGKVQDTQTAKGQEQFVLFGSLRGDADNFHLLDHVAAPCLFFLAILPRTTALVC